MRNDRFTLPLCRRPRARRTRPTHGAEACAAGRGGAGQAKGAERSGRAGRGPAFNISSLVCDIVALSSMLHTHNLLALFDNANPPTLPRHRHFPKIGMAWWSASKRVTIQIWHLCLISLSNLWQWHALSQAYCLGLQCLPARKFELGNLSIIVSWSGLIENPQKNCFHDCINEFGSFEGLYMDPSYR